MMETKTKEPSVQLLQVAHSPYCQTVAVALAEKGVPFYTIEEDLVNKSQRLLEASPVHKKVPVLIHNGRPIADSRIIVQYIDDTWPISHFGDGRHSFFPDSPYEKAQALFWADFIHLKVAGPLHQMVKGRDSEIDKKAFDENMSLLNSAIIQCGKDEGPFFFGKRFGIVDFTFAPFISWFSSFEKYVNLPIPSSTQAPRLHEWMEAVTQYPTIKPLLTDPASIEQTVERCRVYYRSKAAATVCG